MLASSCPSWAQVVVNGTGESLTLGESLPFSWRLAKRGRLKPSKAITLTSCPGPHCQLSKEHCQRSECMSRIESQLSKLKTNNTALAATFQVRLLELDKAREDILEHCDMEAFFSDGMEATRAAVLQLRRKKADTVFCECASCQLVYQQHESALLEEKLAAAQRRFIVLREYRLANGVATKLRTSSNSEGGTKYFTPVGSSKAKGVTALRPTLQMQSSYNFAALTTNTMASRPLKVAWRDKPRTLRIGKSGK